MGARHGYAKQGGELKRPSRRDEEISLIIVACKYRYNIPTVWKREKRERKQRYPPPERTNQLREIELLPIDPGQRVIN